jgi:hypothetical protein
LTSIVGDELHEDDARGWKERIHARLIVGVSSTLRRGIVLIGSQFKKSMDLRCSICVNCFGCNPGAIGIRSFCHDQDSPTYPDSPRLLTLFNPVEV